MRTFLLKVVSLYSLLFDTILMIKNKRVLITKLKQVNFYNDNPPLVVSTHHILKHQQGNAKYYR